MMNTTPIQTAGSGSSATRISLRLTLMAGLLGSTTLGWAHNPVCICKKHGGDEVRCVGGFSDGSKAAGVKLDVIAYDETIVKAGKLGPDSSLVFKRPKGEFYVLFDAGPGHVVEVDHTDID
ncbi:MAG TPA: hypothetical protein VFY22_10540 [Hydrogenophaga sp.]|nr:hypothetical protein [Hydrogenophaga sp.]